MAKKNEAKIKFTAETGGFNDSIKKANQQMSELRAELKLNETQMKTTGETVEGLERKHKILSDQLQASHDKTEALNQKVNKAIEIYGENSDEVSKLRTQLLNAQTAEEKIKQSIQACNDELDAQRKASEAVEDAHESLTDKIKRQQSELDGLKNDYAELVASGKGASDEAKNLARSIEDLSGELKDSKKEMSNASKMADELDKSLEEVDDSAENAGDGFTILGGAVADLASSAIQGAIGKISEFIGYLADLPQATMELRQDMGTLTTAFDNVGMSTDTAKETWKELYAVFGEDDRAVETANHIARMADSQEDLNDWVTITTGVWATYQDSLPVEGLAEASAETAKTGTVTGNLADALNWSSEASQMFAKYMSDDVVTAEDAFNVALSECTTEQERQQLITETLTKLYGESADTYRETTSAQMEAKEATAEHILAEANLATAIEPVTTKFNEMKASILTGILPAVEKFSGIMLDALDWMQEHPVLMKSIAVTVGVLATALGILTGVVLAYTIAQWAMNSAILANPITWVVMGIIAVIAVLAGVIVAIVHYWDEIVVAVKNAGAKIVEVWNKFVSWLDSNVIQPISKFFTELWDGIVATTTETWGVIKEFFSGLWTSISTTATEIWNSILTFFMSIPSWIDVNVIQPIVGFFTGLWIKMQEIWNTIVNVIQVALMFVGSIISGAVQIITLPFMFIWENCKEYVFQAWEWIKEKVTTGINFVKDIITNVMTAIKTVFSTIWDAIVTKLTSVFETITLAVSTVWTAISETLSTIWNAISAHISSVLDSIMTVISTAWEAIKTATTTAFEAIKTVASNVWNSIKTTVSSIVDGIKTAISTAWNAVKTTTETIFNGVKSVASNVWNSIKTTVSNIVNGVKSTISTAWNTVKSTTSNVFNSIKSTATSVWNGVKTAITKPIEEAKEKIKSGIDSIKGFFSGMKLEFPKIKMPHFKISGSFSLDPPSVPSLGIEWYKDGGILTKPTIFGMHGMNLMAGGEAGAEAILPIDRLEGYIAGAIEKTMQVADVQALADAVEDLANRPIMLNVNGKNFATATANDTDNVNGLRSSFKSRGLVLA